MAQAKEAFSQEIVEEVAEGIMSVSEEEAYGGDMHELMEVMDSMVETVEVHMHEIETPEEDAPLIKKVNKVGHLGWVKIEWGNNCHLDIWSDCIMWLRQTMSSRQASLINPVNRCQKVFM